MMMNENQKLPRNAKPKAKRKLETGRKLLTLKNAIKQATKRKNNDKIKNFEK